MVGHAQRLSLGSSVKTGRIARKLLILLTCLNTLNFVDRQLVLSLAPQLMRDLGINRAQVGLLYGYSFLILYTAAGLLLGVVADRWHRPRLIAIGLCVWSTCTIFSGAVTGFLRLASARAMVGIGEATLTPASLSMISDVYETKRRAFASGVYCIGVPLGSGLSMIISGWMAIKYGWRSCFYVPGALGLMVCPFVFLLRDPERATSRPTNIQKSTEIYGDLTDTLRRSPTLWLTMLGGSLYSYLTASAPLALTFLVTERNMPYQRAAYINGLISCFAGTVGVVLGGIVSDLFQKIWASGRLVSLVIMIIVAVAFWLGFAVLQSQGVLFYIFWSGAILGTTIWLGPVFAIVADLVSPEIRTTAIALFVVLLNVCGTGLGPWITGLIGDAYSLERGIVIGSFIALSSIVPLLLAVGTYAKDRVAL